jgi:hypothetical protein
VIISEIFLNSAESKAAEFVELYNRSDSAVELAGSSTVGPTSAWRIEEGIQFSFPPGTVIPAHEFLVITGGDPRYVRERFDVPPSVQVIGPFAGILNSAGTTIALVGTEFDQGTGAFRSRFQERVDFAFHALLPQALGSVGTALRRLDLNAYGNDPNNWTSASPSPGWLDPIDKDGDGLPDEWEVLNGGSAADPTDRSKDLDGDSHTLWDEYVAGTDPGDASDHLFLQISQNGSDWRISLPTRKATGTIYAGLVRSYMIEGCSAASTNWVPMTDWIIGSGQTIVVEHALPDTAESRLFRAVVALMPQVDP